MVAVYKSSIFKVLFSSDFGLPTSDNLIFIRYYISFPLNLQ